MLLVERVYQRKHVIRRNQYCNDDILKVKCSFIFIVCPSGECKNNKCSNIVSNANNRLKPAYSEIQCTVHIA